MEVLLPIDRMSALCDGLLDSVPNFCGHDITFVSQTPLPSYITVERNKLTIHITDLADLTGTTDTYTFDRDIDDGFDTK